jgi:hypothetical protein
MADFRERGDTSNADADVLCELSSRTGALLMGRTMFDAGEVPWGDDPPFGMPVFVLTHRPRETVTKQGGTTYTFVTDGLARTSQGGRWRQGRRARWRRQPRPTVSQSRDPGRDPDPPRARAARRRHEAVRPSRRRAHRAGAYPRGGVACERYAPVVPRRVKQPTVHNARKSTLDRATHRTRLPIGPGCY